MTQSTPTPCAAMIARRDGTIGHDRTFDAPQTHPRRSPVLTFSRDFVVSPLRGLG